MVLLHECSIEMNLLIVIISIFLIQQLSTTDIEPSPQLHFPVFLEHPHVINRRQTDQPIRITPIYDTDPTSFLTSQQRTYVEDIIMANITNFFSSLISVKPLGVPIRSARACKSNYITTVTYDDFQSFVP